MPRWPGALLPADTWLLPPANSLHLVEMIFKPSPGPAALDILLAPCERDQGLKLEIPSPLSCRVWSHGIFRVTSLLRFIKILVRGVRDMFLTPAAAARQIHFEVGILVLLQQAAQEEECSPLMFISYEHCWPLLELISCMVPFKNRKYILPAF